MDGKKKKILCVLAHPDDEVIFAWPILQDPSIEKEMLICVSDLHNKEKTWGVSRKNALGALCAHLGLPYTCLDLNSDFSKAPDRKRKPRGLRKFLPIKRSYPLLREVGGSILTAMDASDCDYIFTHNFWGEYGHMDHILVNTLVLANAAKPVFFTDAMLQLYPMPLKQQTPAIQALLEGHFHSPHIMDRSFYEECASFYKSTGTWTWDEPPVERVNLYRFG